MKKGNKLVLILVLLLTLVFPTVAFGEDIVNENTDVEEPTTTVDEVTEDEDVTEEEKEENNNGNGKGKNKAWKEAKAAVELEKDEIEALKDEVEKEIKELELQLEAAETAGDEATVATLKAEIQVLKDEKNEYKVQMKEKISEMKQIMKEKYTLEELTELEEVAEALEALENVSVIPVENVIIETGDAKFDTPPIIKEGRTLIPVRAISEGMGADVTYNAEEKIVTITKDDKIIVFNLAENKVYVDEAEIAIDVPAEVMNSRTMVPLRFIAEQLGLNVEYEEELQTIIIE